MTTILAYHGVTDLPPSGIENFQDKHLAADEFARQMQWLRERERVLSLTKLVEHHRDGRDVDGVVVTFDDGYRNNLTVALPILERYEIPATFFLTTGFLGTNRLFWVDEVEFLIDRTDAASIDLTGFGLYDYPLGSAEQRKTAVTEIKSSLKLVDDDLRRAAVDRIRASLRVPAGQGPGGNYALLSWPEVRRLADHPLVEIGAHSVDHPILTRIGPERLDREVRESKAALEQHVGRPIRWFAYPNGAREDYNAQVIDVVKAHGFECGCTTLPGPNAASTGLFELQRVMVGLIGEPFPCRSAAVL